MKLNGKNIITDQDITITGGNLGNNLSEVLQNHDSDISKLKGEVKWLYKYGGVGSGGGGGAGGGSSTWGIHATLGGRTLTNGGTIPLNQGEDNISYVLTVAIKNGNGNYFVEYTYDGGKFGRMTLNSENGWKDSTTISLPRNSFINIQVSDGSDIKNLETTYITNPYRFEEIKLVNNNGAEYQNINNDIFISNAKSNGLKARINYSVSIEAEVKYSWELLGFKMPEQTLDISENKEHYFEIEYPSQYLENSFAGLYEIKCNITVQAVNQEADKIQRSKTFNLIPETLYLKVSPEVGTIYDEIITENLFDVYSYKTGAAISLTIRAYFGTNQNMSGDVEYHSYDLVGGTEVLIPGATGNIDIIENKNATIQLFYLTAGWKKLVLTCSLRGETTIVTKYIYLTETVTSYSWYKKSAEPNEQSTSYFRLGECSEKMSSIFNNVFKQINISDQNLVLDKNIILTPTSDSVGDILISLGIQYSEINNTNNPIASFNYSDGNNLKPFCTIYQNNIVVENNTIETFLGRAGTDIYNPATSKNYHLIQILLRHTYLNEAENLDYKQVCIYIDGVLEGAVTNWLNYTREISNVVLYPGNYSINLLEVANFSGWKTRTIQDVDINYYYNTYLIKSNVIEESSIEKVDTGIIDSLYSYDASGNAAIGYSIENNTLKLSGSAAITQISSCLKVPSLVCKVEKYLTSYDPTNNTTLFDWINGNYDEQDNSSINTGLKNFRCPAELRWYNKPSGDGSGINFDPNLLISGSRLFGQNTEFYLRLQGSSTMRYKSKNFTLGVHNTSGDENQAVPLFSPNFRKDDKTTFLPDSAFTLKADVVDSSHSNNTSLGKFINEIYSAERSGKNFGPNPSGDLAGHVKTTLEGFPIILFLEVTDSINGADTEYYYLGIYNFNLGRENYLNLGYMDLKMLDPLVESNPVYNEYSFISLSVPNSSYEPNKNLIVAEVQGNSPMWDFSQYQDSVLFKVDSISGDNNFMFGDIVYGSGEYTSYKNKISSFVKSISAAGNYIFTKLGKQFSNIVDVETGDTISNIAYRTINTVPDCDNQFSRRSDGKLYNLVDREGNPNLNPPRTDTSSFTINLLNSCIRTIDDGSGNDILPFLDYETAVYYYTICMAFGLVDSVQKNLNIKSWNGRTFGLYFYDMDTALGTSNSGDNTSYFCFSDYWKTDITPLEDENGDPVYDEYGNPVYKNSGAAIFRDYYPKDENLPAGYDIPSTYLFAVSKYAASFNKELSSAEDAVNLESPQNLWGKWRQRGGILETSEKFIEKYFQGHLKDIPGVLINLDYRTKYLYGTVGTEFNATDRNCLKGRLVEKVRDWLTSRFHILDAYFNLGKETVLLQKVDEENSYYEPTCSLDTLNRNPDIQILHDIFSPIDENGISTTLNREGELKFRVRAKNYTPLIHKHANIIDRFLLENENVTYEISVVYNGNQTSKFGGSDGWTYLDSLNSFINTLQNKGAFSVKTKKLEYLEGTSGTLTGSIKLDIPSTRDLILTSPGYECKVSIDSKFYNLTNVDISNTKIDLTVSGSNVATITADNVSSPAITLSSCNNLKTVSLVNATIDKFTATPVWDSVKDNLNLTNTKIKELVLRGHGGTLTINNSSTLKSLTFSGFSSVTITGCPNLENIISNDSSEAILKTFIVTGALGLDSITLVSDNITKLDLHGCTKLKNLDLRKLNTTDESDLSQNKLTYLDISGTSLKRITRSIKNGASWVETANREGVNKLFIIDYPNLVTLKVNNNPELEYVQFTTDIEKPFSLTGSFENCTSLKRVYGNISINVSRSFYNCRKFSIHGYFLNSDGKVVLVNPENTNEKIQFNGIPVIENSGRTIHPRETIGDSRSMVVEIVTGKYGMAKQSGEEVTNINIPSGNTSVLSNAFTNTSCTTFDIYYIFQNLSGASSGLNISNCFYNDGTGGKGPGMKFSWTSEFDNSPSRYTFMDWGSKIGNMNQSLRNRCDHVRIFTTYTDSESGKEIGGLFYYLPNITDLSTTFLGSKMYTDKNIFTLPENKTFDKLTTVYYFSPMDFIEGINELSYDDIFSEDGSYKPEFLIECFKEGGYMRLGDLSGLFRNCPKITYLSNNFNTLGYIDYNKGKFDLPNTIQYINYSFISSYAIGELRLSDLFTGTENITSLTGLNQSFRVNNSIESYINNLGAGDYASEEIKDAYITIDNEFFTRFKSLTSIGFVATGIDASSSVMTSDYSSFGGALKKKLRDGEFPYNIIDHLPNLKTFTGFFRGCDSINNEGKYLPIKLPGDLFKGKNKLTNVSRTFQNFKGIIELSKSTDSENNTNFTDCVGLVDISYLFCNSKPLAADYLAYGGDKLGIISMIPYKFFYHGENITSKSVFGTSNTATLGIDSSENWEIDENNYTAVFTQTEIIIGEGEVEDVTRKTVYTYSGIKDFVKNGDTVTQIILNPTSKKSVEIFENNVRIESSQEFIGNLTDEFGLAAEEVKLENIVNPFATITNMEYCFQGQGWIMPYDNNGQLVIETNPIYQPHDFLYNTSNRSWTKATNKCMLPETCMWSYDGNDNFEGDYYNLDEDIDFNITGNINSIPAGLNATASEQCIKNFFCPPDLFRYCKENVNITKLFYHTGYSEHFYLQNSDFSKPNTFIGFGITGRICPYLLKPIPKVTSLEGFLTNAKRLSYYTLIARDSNGNVLEDTVGETYIIPKTFFTYATEVVNLTNTFQGFNFPVGCSFNVFSPLTKPLTLDGTFKYSYYHSNETTRARVSGLFLNKSIVSARGTFTVDLMNTTQTNNSSLSYVTDQNIDFGINFTKSKLPTETGSDNLKVQFVYDGYNKNSITFAGVDLETGKSKDEFKYHNEVLTASPFNYRTR